MRHHSKYAWHWGGVDTAKRKVNIVTGLIVCSLFGGYIALLLAR